MGRLAESSGRLSSDEDSGCRGEPCDSCDSGVVGMRAADNMTMTTPEKDLAKAGRGRCLVVGG